MVGSAFYFIEKSVLEHPNKASHFSLYILHSKYFFATLFFFVGLLSDPNISLDLQIVGGEIFPESNKTTTLYKWKETLFSAGYLIFCQIDSINTLRNVPRWNGWSIPQVLSNLHLQINSILSSPIILRRKSSIPYESRLTKHSANIRRSCRNRTSIIVSKKQPKIDKVVDVIMATTKITYWGLRKFAVMI